MRGELEVLYFFTGVQMKKAGKVDSQRQSKVAAVQILDKNEEKATANKFLVTENDKI